MDLVRIILVYILTLQNREKSFFYVFFMFYQLMQWEKNITVKLIVVIHSYKWTHDAQWTSNDEEEKKNFKVNLNEKPRIHHQQQLLLLKNKQKHQRPIITIKKKE